MKFYIRLVFEKLSPSALPSRQEAVAGYLWDSAAHNFTGGKAWIREQPTLNQFVLMFCFVVNRLQCIR